MEKEVVDVAKDNVNMEEEKKDAEKVVLKVNYEPEGEKKEVEAESSKAETQDASVGGAVASGPEIAHICSPSIESCPSPVSGQTEGNSDANTSKQIQKKTTPHKLTPNCYKVSDEKEGDDGESGSSLSTLSLPSRS